MPELVRSGSFSVSNVRKSVRKPAVFRTYIKRFKPIFDPIGLAVINEDIFYTSYQP